MRHGEDRQVDRAGTARRVAPARAERLVLGRYRLRRRLGVGAFGAVWLARDERLERDVAVKVLPRDPRWAGRAQREAVAAARLGHPAIVTLFEAGADEDDSYLVSELVRGSTLAALFAQGALSDRDVVRIGIALCDALGHAHSQGVIHRDVKPSNVIVPEAPESGAGIVKLTDFGVASMAGVDALTRTGDVVGTLAYMPPEQAAGHRVTAAVDLYSLALVLYEALAGFNPGRSGARALARRAPALSALRRHRRDLPSALGDAIDRALAPDPACRGTLSELRMALTATLSEVDDEPGSIAASPLELGRAARPRPVLSRRVPSPRLVAGLGAAVLTAIALAGLDTGPPPLAPALGAAVAGALTALWPRAGWLLAAAALLAWLAGPGGRPGEAVVIAVGVLAVPLLLPRAGEAWSLPAAAPALGPLALAGAHPALAVWLRGPWRRAALGALGLWWLLLAELETGARLLFGPAPGTWSEHAWRSDAGAAISHALWPMLRSGAVAVALVWALAAVILPWLLRGRSTVLDLLLGAAWATALSAGVVAVAHLAHGSLAHATALGGPLGAFVGAGAAVLAVRARSTPAPAAPPPDEWDGVA